MVPRNGVVLHIAVISACVVAFFLNPGGGVNQRRAVLSGDKTELFQFLAADSPTDSEDNKPLGRSLLILVDRFGELDQWQREAMAAVCDNNKNNNNSNNINSNNGAVVVVVVVGGFAAPTQNQSGGGLTTSFTLDVLRPLQTSGSNDDDTAHAFASSSYLKELSAMQWKPESILNRHAFVSVVSGLLNHVTVRVTFDFIGVVDGSEGRLIQCPFSRDQFNLRRERGVSGGNAPHASLVRGTAASPVHDHSQVSSLSPFHTATSYFDCTKLRVVQCPSPLSSSTLASGPPSSLSFAWIGGTADAVIRLFDVMRLNIVAARSMASPLEPLLAMAAEWMSREGVDGEESRHGTPTSVIIRDAATVCSIEARNGTTVSSHSLTHDFLLVDAAGGPMTCEQLQIWENRTRCQRNTFPFGRIPPITRFKPRTAKEKAASLHKDVARFVKPAIARTWEAWQPSATLPTSTTPWVGGSNATRAAVDLALLFPYDLIKELCPDEAESLYRLRNISVVVSFAPSHSVPSVETFISTFSRAHPPLCSADVTVLLLFVERLESDSASGVPTMYRDGGRTRLPVALLPWGCWASNLGVPLNHQPLKRHSSSHEHANRLRMVQEVLRLTQQQWNVGRVVVVADARHAIFPTRTIRLRSVMDHSVEQYRDDDDVDDNDKCPQDLAMNTTAACGGEYLAAVFDGDVVRSRTEQLELLRHAFVADGFATSEASLLPAVPAADMLFGTTQAMFSTLDLLIRTLDAMPRWQPSSLGVSFSSILSLVVLACVFRSQTDLPFRVLFLNPYHAPFAHSVASVRTMMMSNKDEDPQTCKHEAYVLMYSANRQRLPDAAWERVIVKKTSSEEHLNATCLQRTTAPPALPVASSAQLSMTAAPPPSVVLQPRRGQNVSYDVLLFLNASLPLTDITGDEPRNAPAVCELMLLGNPRCRIIHGEETMYDCVKRYGVHAWSAALQPQCTKSDFWKSITVELGPLDTGEYSKKYYELYDPIMRWHLAPVLAEVRRRAGVPNPPLASAMDDNGPVAQLHPPLNCSYGLVHPFGFCTPQAALVDDRVPSIKLYDWFPISPGYMPGSVRGILGPRPFHVIGASDELLAATLYRLSYFAWTHRRSGVDCKRHYEILAYGAVPLFPDLRWVAPPIVSHLPRELMYEAFSLPGIEHVGDLAQARGPVNTAFYYRRGAEQVNFKGPGSINWTTFNETSYHHLAHRLYQFTSQNTVCHAMMRRALQTLGYANATVWRSLRVLIVGPPSLDYQTVDVETGLVELGIEFASNHNRRNYHNASATIAFMERERLARNSDNITANGTSTPTVTLEQMITGEEYALWRQSERLEHMYGKNFMTGLRTPMPSRILSTQDELCGAIRNKEFDLVVYATQKVQRQSATAEFSCEAESAALLVDAKDNSIGASVPFSVAVFDGYDVPTFSHYPRWDARGFTVFSREAQCK